MIKFIFKKSVEKLFLKLPPQDKERIKSKLKQLKNHENIFTVLGKLKDFSPATHRLRIGDYRVILALVKHKNDQIEFLVLDLGHRKDVYR